MNARALSVVTAYAAALENCLSVGDLVGVYLTGSAVSGEFDEGVSDIDVLTVHRSCAEQLPGPALGRLHHDLAMSLEWASRMEVAYLPLPGLRPWGVQGHCLSWSAEGLRLGPSHAASDDVLAARRHAVVVRGMPTGSVFPEVSEGLFLRQTQEYLSDLLTRPAPSGGEAAADRIANIARCLQRLATRQLGSKATALRWWGERDTEVHEVVQAVVAARHGDVAAQQRCAQGLALLIERATVTGAALAP